MGRQIVDALSPANFALTNPAVLREMRETNGESLMRGLQKLGEDLKDAEHGLRPQQVDMDAFEVGVNLATTPGAVVFRSPVMERHGPLSPTFSPRSASRLMSGSNLVPPPAPLMCASATAC